MNKTFYFGGDMVGQKFDEHIKGQLPWYEFATNMVSMITDNYIGSGGIVYDIGASTGNVSLSISNCLQKHNAEIISLESSEEMASTWNGVGQLVIADACDYNFKRFDVAILFLTLMFIHPSKRLDLIAKLREKKKEGGVIIVVDKSTQANGYLDVVFRRMTMCWKLNSGQTHKQALEKDLSLAGIQRPITESEISGAKEFFRAGEFAGWVIE